ncbi:MAG: MFS transporter [Pedobacter sp.]
MTFKEACTRAREVLPGNVLALGMVSLFTDFSSEMIYPLLPTFFTGLVSPAVAAVYIGVMDGVADSAASLLKVASGHLSDRSGRRKLLALGGYGLSTVARPLMAIAVTGWQVVGMRFLDRIGKGVRTAPRDALIVRSVGGGRRSLAFSFHRMMDHAGAVAGPLVAIVFLSTFLGHTLLWQQGDGVATAEQMHVLRWLFALALLPGIASMLILQFGVREVATLPPPRQPVKAALKTIAIDPYWRSRLKHYLAAFTLFALGNSSDLFLIFFAQTRFGLGMGYLIVLWVYLHLSKVILSLPGGWLADRWGKRPAIICGWLIYVTVYLLLPEIETFGWIWGAFFAYGAYYGLTEGAERALMADVAPVEFWGRAYGWYHGLVGLAALPASLLFGVFWATLGPRNAFRISAGLALVALVLLVGIKRKIKQPESTDN